VFKPLNVLFLFALIAFGTATVLSTAQIPDRLRFGGREYLLYSEPLEQRYASDWSKKPGLRPFPFMGSSALERGYVATWEIRKDRLYLVGIDSWICGARAGLLDISCRHAMLEDILGATINARTQFASWYTGELRVPQGRQLLYVHLPYQSIYERDVIFRVRAGLVDQPKTVDNRKKLIPSEYGSADRYAPPLGSFDILSPPPDPLGESRELITAGVGFGKVLLGAPEEQIREVLGPSERLYLGYQAVDEFHVDYIDSLVQITYDLPNKTAAAIYFNNMGTRSRGFKTDRGISFHANTDDVRKAYGEPVEIRKIAVSETSYAAATDYRYSGIEFRFENDKLTRIAIRKVG
jgi:hypothetical protein